MCAGVTESLSNLKYASPHLLIVYQQFYPSLCHSAPGNYHPCVMKFRVTTQGSRQNYDWECTAADTKFLRALVIRLEHVYLIANPATVRKRITRRLPQTRFKNTTGFAGSSTIPFVLAV